MHAILAFLQRNRITLLSIAVLAATAALAWRALATPLDPYIHAEYAVARGEPEYKDIIGFHPGLFDWQEYDYPAPPPMADDTTTVYLSFRIPLSARFVRDHILFSTTNQDAFVYLDNELIYSYGDWDQLTDSRGRAFHYVHLDESMAGKRLTIMLHSGYRGWIGSIDYLAFGSERALIGKVSAADAVYIASLAVALTLLALLVMNLFWRGLQTDRRMHLYLIGFLVSFVLWTTGTSSFFPRTFGFAPLWWELHLMMLYVMPLFIFLVTREIVPPETTARVQYTLRVFALIFVVASIGEVIGLDGYMNLLFLFYPVFLVGCLLMIYTAGCADWSKYPSCRYSALTMVAFVAFTAIDVLHWEYHLLSAMLSTTVFYIYASLPFIFHIVREQTVRDVRLAQQNEVLSRELEISQNEAQRDFLTGAYNRHQLGDSFAKFAALAQERGFHFSFAIFDVDHFKTVNDTRGHLAGDAILRTIADTVHASIDRRHIFIRYGGDEFILLALHYDLDAMIAFCDALRQVLARELDGVTMSFGVSTWHGREDRLRGLIDRADRALYRSKKKGRNVVSGETETGTA